ncbi:MAG: hypothetical protein OQJ89_15675, partial [Kangiellaceae bacterium]|nr:hypothetical protein [Kangiellaceae bacterium]
YQLYFQLINIISSSILLIICSLFISGMVETDELKKIYSVSLVILLVSFCASAYIYFELNRRKITLSFSLSKDIALISLQKFFKAVALCFFIAAWLAPWSAMIEIITAFIAAMQAGVLAIFAPAGIGVTEGVYILLLSNIFGISLAFKIAIIARILQTSLDLLLAAVALCLNIRISRLSKTFKSC